MKFTRFPGLVPAVLLSLLGVPEVTSAQSPRYGVVTFSTADRVISKMLELGAGTARVGCYWWQLEPARGIYDWRCSNDIINNSGGLTLYFGLHDTPGWANGGLPGNYPPTDMNDWYDFVFATISQYRGRGIVWEVWNEPNLDHFLIDDGTGSVYKQLFAVAALARNAAGPGEILAGPETSHHAVRSGYFQSVIQDMTTRMAPQDVVSVHLYPDGPRVETYLEEIDWYRAGHEMSLTETGRDSVDLELQRSWYEYVLYQFTFGPYSWWTRVIFYRLHSGLDCCDESITYADWTNKTAFTFFQDWIRFYP